MPRTGCRYTLFGVKYDKHVLRNVLRHLLPELYGRDPDGLRRCVQSVKWLVERNEGLSGAAFQVAPDLWAETRWCSRGNLQEECWSLIDAMGVDRSDFVIRGFSTESTGIEPGERAGPANPAADTHPINEFHQDLFIPRDHFARLLTSIQSRKNLILQGPPGTGKTFIARRIAWCLIGRQDNGPIEMVQFHQSYAYEDFVQGYRPTDDGGFNLKDGVFHRFCERARANPGTPHVFIIDEINRGNLSRIFGELLMLIEADKRSEDYAVALIYSEKRFHVPENVFILGMMNTADRSLALVDYALRRRFAFETLEPAFGRPEFEKYLIGKGADPDLVRRISERMGELNARITNDNELGRGFQIGHSYFVPGKGDKPSEAWYQHIVDTQIAPLLREYWFDSPKDVEKAVTRLTADPQS